MMQKTQMTTNNKKPVTNFYSLTTYKKMTMKNEKDVDKKRIKLAKLVK